MNELDALRTMVREWADAMDAYCDALRNNSSDLAEMRRRFTAAETALRSEIAR